MEMVKVTKAWLALVVCKLFWLAGPPSAASEVLLQAYRAMAK